MLRIVKLEFCWFKSIFLTYWKNPLFFPWLFFFLFIVKRFWVIYLILILYLITSTLCLFFKKNPEIVLTDKKFNIFINYFRINTLISLKNAKFDHNFFFLYVLFYAFRLIFGVSYKFVKMSFSLFDCLHREYIWGNLRNKKINIRICKKYLSRSFENFLFVEFIKKKPNIAKEIVFNWWKKNITIRIVTPKK